MDRRGERFPKMLMRTNSKDYGEGREPFEPPGDIIAQFVGDYVEAYVEATVEPLRQEIKRLRSEVRELQRRK